jgi:hypothetical protein
MNSTVIEQLVQYSALGTCLVASLVANWHMFKHLQKITADFTKIQTEQTKVMEDLKDMVIKLLGK